MSILIGPSRAATIIAVLMPCVAVVCTAQTKTGEYVPASSEPEDLVVTDSGLFFTADDGFHGRELWYLAELDGDPQLVWDQTPGIDGSRITQLYSVGDLVSYSKETGGRTDLWISDGTRRGTNHFGLIEEVGMVGYGQPMGMIGSTLVFTANESENITGIWSLDLDSNNLEQMVTLDRQGHRLSVELMTFGVMSDRIYFGATQLRPSLMDSGLYRTDGTPEGTVRVKGLYQVPSEILPLDSERVLFQASSEDEGNELWVSDGTESGTHILLDIVPGAGSSSPGEFARIENGEDFYFAANHPTSGRELWVTNGTMSGTRLVKDIFPGAGDGEPYKLITTAHRLFFIAKGPGQGRELWTSKGTEESTLLLKEIYPGPTGSNPYAFCLYNDVLYFSALDAEHGEELWRSDGTPEGTWLLADINPGPASSFPYHTTVFDGHIVFSAEHPLTGREVWVTNGRKDGIRLLLDLAQDGQNNPSSSPQGMTATPKLLFFAADDVKHGMELWATDGTPENTRMVRDIFPGRASSDPQEFLAVGEDVFFRADNGTHGTELWMSDGTRLGTKMVQNMAEVGGSGPRELHLLNGKVVFVAYSEVTGTEMWIGDASGAEVLMDIRPGSEGSNPKDLVIWNDRVYFTADDGVHGEELWVSTGDKDKTHMVTDIISVPIEQAGISRPTVFKDSLFFARSDLAHGRELWRLSMQNETAAMLKDIARIGQN